MPPSEGAGPLGIHLGPGAFSQGKSALPFTYIAIGTEPPNPELRSISLMIPNPVSVFRNEGQTCVVSFDWPALCHQFLGDF